jgi:dihydroflavonol-4-reductase
MIVLAAQRFFRLAVQAGVMRCVLLGSYFAHFDRVWPKLQLAKHHPYIRSRVEHESVVIKAAGDQLDVMILQLPYIFGNMPGRFPMWKPLVDYLHWPLPWVFYSRGGSAMVAVDQVADAIVGALEQGKGGERYMIGDENLSWEEWLQRMMKIAGIEKRVVSLPNGLVKLGLLGLAGWNKLRGLEGGLDPRDFSALQTRKTFLIPSRLKRRLVLMGKAWVKLFGRRLRVAVIR